jgi:hypothetical protein
VKKLRILILVALITFILPEVANASSIRMTCKNATVNSETTCTVTGTSSALEDIEGSVTISGGVGSISSLTPGSGFTGMANNPSYFSYVTDYNMTGTFTIMTININTTVVGTGTVTLNVQNATTPDSVNKTAAAQFQVTGASATTTTAKKTTTTKKTTTQRNAVVSPVVTTTSPSEITTQALESLKLTSVKVDDFNVTYENGIYYATTYYYTESVNVSAESTEGVTVIGTGVRSLAYGKNVVELVLRDISTGQTNTYQVVITRPDDSNSHNTQLTNLKVVDYGMEFSPDTLEYTIKVPYTVNELYVIAETLNDDVNISGAGLKTLTKGKNTIYVKVSYGDETSTQYIINVKRSYKSLILLIIAILLGIGLIAMLIYALINRKAAIEARRANSNRMLANSNRESLTNTNVQISGQSVVGVGRKTVVPTKVVNVKTPDQMTGAGVTQQVVTRNLPPTVKVVRTTPEGYENKMVIENQDKNE